MLIKIKISKNWRLFYLFIELKYKLMMGHIFHFLIRFSKRQQMLRAVWLKYLLQVFSTKYRSISISNLIIASPAKEKQKFLATVSKNNYLLIIDNSCLLERNQRKPPKCHSCTHQWKYIAIITSCRITTLYHNIIQNYYSTAHFPIITYAYCN